MDAGVVTAIGIGAVIYLLEVFGKKEEEDRGDSEGSEGNEEEHNSSRVSAKSSKTASTAQNIGILEWKAGGGVDIVILSAFTFICALYSLINNIILLLSIKTSDGGLFSPLEPFLWLVHSLHTSCILWYIIKCIFSLNVSPN